MSKPALHLATALLALALAAPLAAQDSSQDATQAPPRGVRGDGPVAIHPYIEANQVFSAELSPNDDTVTYTQVAAGVDATVAGRNNGGSVSLRYERTFGYDNSVVDASTLSGIARGYATVVPRALTVEAGALATRTRIDGNGGATLNPVEGDNATSRIYSAYAGPNLHTSAGDAEINANYRLGYTRVEAPDALVVAPGATAVDVFDDSVVQSAGVHVGTRPNEPLPVGVGIGGAYYQEDISNLDQRVRDANVRADVTVPLGPDLAAVGGVGYEDVEISSRDALRNAGGVPVVDGAGRFVTDKSAPRQIAYDVSGLIWDVGVLWRPSTRTSLEAHVGRRYDSTTYYGSFAWAPDSRSAFNVSAYDGITGFGGTLNRALVSLPTSFTANRNAVTGDFGGCVASLQGGNCLTGVLGSVRSATFRGRGIAATFAQQVGWLSAGVGAGYDRRNFIAAPGTVLAVANGTIDQSWWASAYITGELSPRDAFAINAYANWLRSGFTNAGDATVLGASASYRRYLLEGLSARAAVSLDNLDSDVAGEDLKTASALLGLRYDF
jgi:hypothetical protein